MSDKFIKWGAFFLFLECIGGTIFLAVDLLVTPIIVVEMGAGYKLFLFSMFLLSAGFFGFVIIKNRLPFSRPICK